MEKETHSDVFWERFSGQIGEFSHQGQDGEIQVFQVDAKREARSAGAFSTRNFLASPSVVNESSLSPILLTDRAALVPYFLSQKAKTGLLRRARKRKKVMISELVNALES